MSYGQSNQPWQRMPFQNVAPQMWQQSPQQSMYPNGSGTIAYPVPFTAAPAATQSYNSIGTVTKINKDCGLINDEVFFYRIACKGQSPKLGDRVLFEALSSTSGQFKWDATRVQLMPPPLMSGSGASGGSGGSSSRTGQKPSSAYNSASAVEYRAHRSPRRSSPGSKRSPPHSRRSPPARRVSPPRRPSPPRRSRGEKQHERVRPRDQDDDERLRERKRRREERSRDRVPPSRVPPPSAPRINREELRREREQSPAHGIRRYKVQIPKFSLACNNLNLHDVQQRYAPLYVPSLFFQADIKWPETFTPDNPLTLRRACQFHIMHKIVEPLSEEKNNVHTPSDADYSFSAKVMLLACPPITEIYQKCFGTDDERNPVQLSRMIHFLVGTRDGNEAAAIGGPWSPSLDGPNPDKDPAVLIRTAIRTCRSLTGIDLSNCTQWYRFCELQYLSEKADEPSTSNLFETVVIYLPDIHSCMPNIEEWQKLSQGYLNAVEKEIARKTQLALAASSNNNASGDTTEAKTIVAEKDTTLESTSKDANTAPTALAAVAAAVNDAAPENSSAGVSAKTTGDEKQQQSQPDTATTPTTASNEDKDDDVKALLDKSTDGDDIENEKINAVCVPTHYSKLDLKTMKVPEMKNELAARNLPIKGVRNVIMARLAKAINAERAEEIQAKKAGKSKTKVEPSKSITEESSQAKDADSKDVIVIEDDVEMAGIKKEDVVNDEKIGDDEKADDDKKAAIDENGATAKTKEALNNEEKKLSEAKTEDQDEQEEWGDGSDVDMNDIVILDEYDSRKNPEESQPKEMTEREKLQLIRRYTLPNTPHVIVHPSKKAKSGQFDCSVVPFSVLLDYPHVNKKRSFEVSLFAELFKEMLMRDFSFTIYKEIYFYNEPTTSNASNETETKLDDRKNSQKTEEKATKDSNSVDNKLEDTQSVKSSSKRKVNADEKDKDKESVKDKKKFITVKPQLLLACLYFDVTHCGYIFRRDLEELFTVMGLNLSRGQIQKMSSKFCGRQEFYYRKLTDKEATADTTPAIEDIEDGDEIKKLALGNCLLKNEIESQQRTPSKRAKTTTASAESENGLTNYNGTVVHVGKLVDQIKRTEKNFSDLEKLYTDLSKQHNELQKDHSKSTNKVKDLQSEVKSLTRKLHDVNHDLSAVNRKYREQQSTVTLVYNRLAPFVVREKEREHKSEISSRSEKDVAEKAKDKQKDKETTKHELERTDKHKAKDCVKNEDKSIKKDIEKEVQKNELEEKTETVQADDKTEMSAENAEDEAGEVPKVEA